MRATVLLLAVAVCGSATPVTYTIAGNLVRFHGGNGSADFEWLSGSVFRFKRDFRPKTGLQLPRTAEAIPFETTERGTKVVLRSRYLIVEVDRATYGVSMQPVGGAQQKMADLGSTRQAAGKVILERALEPSERIYGIGRFPSRTLDGRGQRITGTRTTVISSSGFGVTFRTPGIYIYDAGSSVPDRFRVAVQGADSLEQFVYYGPSPKEILDQRRQQLAADELPSEYLRVLRESELPGDASRMEPQANACDAVAELAQLSMAGAIYPALDGIRVDRPLAVLAPLLYVPDSGDPATLAPDRRRWIPYLRAYLREGYDRGFPILRPLAMQYWKDAALANVADVIMIGDELLLAPPCDDSGKRSLRLPMGTWTDLRDNREYKGRTTVELRATADSWPILSRNGQLFPIDAGDRTELHYFPELGAEFFLFEPDVNDHSQFHASPAGDYWRLEAESKVRRRYEWVMHHVMAPREVSRDDFRFQGVATRDELRPGTWFYDEARRNLHVMVDALARTDDIVNIRF